jgi:hypothetical protein
VAPHAAIPVGDVGDAGLPAVSCSLFHALTCDRAAWPLFSAQSLPISTPLPTQLDFGVIECALIRTREELRS